MRFAAHSRTVIRRFAFPIRVNAWEDELEITSRCKTTWVNCGTPAEELISPEHLKKKCNNAVTQRFLYFSLPLIQLAFPWDVYLEYKNADKNEPLSEKVSICTKYCIKKEKHKIT